MHMKMNQVDSCKWHQHCNYFLSLVQYIRHNLSAIGGWEWLFLGVERFASCHSVNNKNKNKKEKKRKEQTIANETTSIITSIACAKVTSKGVGAN